LGTSCFGANINQTTNGGNHSNTSVGSHSIYYVQMGHAKQNCFKLKKKETQYNYKQPSNSNCEQENYDSQGIVFAAMAKNEKFTEDIWICDSGACGHYCNSTKGLFNIEEFIVRILYITAKV
jgi:hypothetical protein